MLKITKSQKHFVVWLGVAFFNVLQILYSILYPYLASYLKLTDSSYTMKTLFNYFFFVYVGDTMASSFVNLYLYFLSFNKVIVLNLFIIIFHNFAFGYCTNPVILILVLILIGSTAKINLILFTLFFKEHHPKNAEWYIVKGYGMQFIGVSFHAFLFSFIINPDNKGRDWAVEEDGRTNYYYSSDVSSNIPKALIINTIAHVIITSILVMVIPQSNTYKGKSLNELSEKKLDSLSAEINSQKDELDKSLSESRFSDFPQISFKNEEVELQERIIPAKANDVRIKIPEEEFSYKKELLSMKFITLFFISMVKISNAVFIIDNFKLQGLALTNDDRLLNITYIISGFLCFFSRSLANVIWDKFGIRNSHILIFTLTIISNIMFIRFVEHSLTVYIIMIFFCRPFGQFKLMVSMLVLYLMYEPKRALKLSMVYDLHIIIALFFVVVLNQYLTFGETYKYVYTVYLFFNVISLILSYFFLQKS